MPVRWNYVHWIQTLLDTTSESYSDTYQVSRKVIGLDIGVGASGIYALLACASRPAWRMLGTDVDSHSFSFAKRNIADNHFGDRVKLRLNAAEAPLIPKDVELDFVMTNPPFYDSHQEMKESYTNKSAPPSSVCTGSENEMICPGGDLGFVLRILAESLVLREQVQWYTAMLGKMTSLQQFIIKLREHEITNFAVTSLTAGYKTKRWAVAWSFGDLRPRNDVARHGDLVQGILPQVTAQTIKVPLMSAQWAGERADAMLKEIDVRWTWRADISAGVLQSKGNVWSRSARRKREREGNEDEAAKKDSEVEGREDEEKDVALAVMITCRFEEVDVRWLQGRDHVLFQSFCGFLKRGIGGRI